jgi:hypothetical protein
MTPTVVAVLTRHLDGMVRAPRLPRLDRVLPVWADIRAALPRLP